MTRLTYRDNDRVLLDCPLCGQAAKVDPHGNGVRCFAGCNEREVLAALDKEQLLRELDSEPQGEQQEAGGTTWAPIDLRPLLNGAAPSNPPTLLPRSDGSCLLYPGKVHGVHGEPEACKSFLGLAGGATLLRAGEHVGYLDFEDTEHTAVERLLALGAAPEEVEQRFHYVRPEEPLTRRADPDLEELIAWGPALVVVDGVNRALGLEGLPLEDNAKVSSWSLPRRLARTGAAVLLLDHVVKDREQRGRYPIGAQAKLALVDGAAYRLDVIEPFGRGRNGLIKLTVAKDRPGHVRAAVAEGGRVAEMHLTSAADGSITVRLEPPDTGAEDRFRPTHLMQRVSEAIEEQPGMTAREIRRLRGKSDALDAALAALVSEGYAEVRHEGRSKKHYSRREYREADDCAPPRGTVPPARSPSTVPPCPPLQGAGARSGTREEVEVADRAPLEGTGS